MLETLAADVRASGQDRKWVELRNILQSDEFNQPGEPRKLIVFTEHRDTLNYLDGKIRTLLGRPEAVVTIHGGVRREDRRRVQDAFRNDPAVKILVATDAAGEGVNLQRANLHSRVVATDVPKPYEIRWKVRNRGPVAKAKSCERGSIFVGGDHHVEPTSFKGPHYVECYIIKDGVCVAAAHIPVNILFTQ